MKLRTKLITMVIITGFIPILFIGSFAYQHAQDNIRKEVFVGNGTYLQETMTQLNDYFEEGQDNGKVVASTKDIYENINTYLTYGQESQEWQNSYNALDQFVPIAEKEYEYDTIFLTDRAGKIIYASRDKEALEGSDLAQREYVKNSLSGKQD